MAKKNSFNDYFPLTTRKDSVEIYRRNVKFVDSPDMNELEKYEEAASIKDPDI